MRTRLSLAVALITGLAVVGCQQPSGGSEPPAAATPAGSSEPGSGAGTPIAPAVEQTHPGHDEPIDVPGSLQLPSVEPVAPAIEPQPTSPEPTIDFDPG